MGAINLVSRSENRSKQERRKCLVWPDSSGEGCVALGVGVRGVSSVLGGRRVFSRGARQAETHVVLCQGGGGIAAHA